MNKTYLVASLLGLYIIPYLDQNPFTLSNIQSLEEGSKTYYIVPENQLNQFEEEQQSIHITAALKKDPEGGLQWGENTERIQSRVAVLREESSMFNQILMHLEESEYPYSISNTQLESAYGAYSSKNGAVQFEVEKMQDYFFDATIIEEFIHAYQALYYGYTHGKFRAQRQKKALKQGKDYSKGRRAGLNSWKKFGRKQAYIESEAKLMTYFIQHQTCSISLQDIVDTDDYNTGGKGRKIIHRYLGRRKCFIRLSRAKKLGHIGLYFVDASTFAAYQQRFISHWRRKAPGSSYTTGYFLHRPEALNNVYAPIANSNPIAINY